MDPGQQFCLRWNNYQSTLQHVFYKLWMAGTFVDVSLVVEGRRLDCHKVVLSACSSYFEHILRDHSSHPHPLILLHDLPYAAVEALVMFMYRGEVNVTQEQLAALLKVAETLRVKGLADSAAISSFTKRQLLERCIPLLEHAPCNIQVPNTLPVPNTLGAITVPTTAIVQPRMTTSRGGLNTGRIGSGMVKHLPTTKKVEGSNTSPGPQRKRPRHDDHATSMPLTPPASLNDTPPNDTSQPSPAVTTIPPETFKQEAADETDGELQIDESAGQSPVNSAECDSNSIGPEGEAEGEGEESLQCVSHDVQSRMQQDIPSTITSDIKPFAQEVRDSSQPFQQIHQASVDSLSTKERSGSLGGKSCERTYTHLDLEEGIEAVLLGQLTPAKAIAQYRIPRRTFFRRLSAVRKSRGIPSAKENAADHFLNATTTVGDATTHLILPVADSDSYAATFKIKSEKPVLIAPKDGKKSKKGDGVMAPNNSYISLLNLAATNNYDAYLNYLKLVTQQGDNANPEEVLGALRKGQVKEVKPAVDDNRNVSEAALALVAHNVSAD
ncbi:broad-complex core protein isoforms 1/2/3/4/5-like [Homarus americanus]|uniref:Tramtrack-like 5 n=1 Tax=Homarus americanus TaxID=6706 RepID=A0A8J5N7W5_HOMAM|nr:broad-complex core protein isoforms 1/2/3/4/5-like [Homarus americanus]XP_042211333.1 broad-complex core protein isoforms 1/2/3/4/5-like [Homarus americanus]XP_042211334.1 broad-complex core protein isoforms 1/2/3/4/5-like [Homarus americanus]XP_042211335.1 broad-complex core protein isoforms 1/2/3/4/5-like [Homarus americanus]KAG7174895.1 tramtrack-like 5 [Homarus americanus]